MFLYKQSYCCCFAFFLLLLCRLNVAGQPPDYLAAEKYDRQKLAPLTNTVFLNPMFVQKSACFWYQFTDDQGTRCYWVDVAQKKQWLLFNKSVVAGRLSQVIKQPVDSNQLNLILPFYIKSNEHDVQFTYKGQHFLYDFYNNEVKNQPAALKRALMPQWGPVTFSKDSTWLLYSQQHNLYLQRKRDGKKFRLSEDGAPNYSFSDNAADSSARKQVDLCNAVWFENKPFFYVLRNDTRRVKTLTVINSLAYPRPRVETYKYELPGDDEVPQQELFIGDTLSKTIAKVNLKIWKDQSISVIGNNSTDNEIYVLVKKRTRDQVALYAVNMHSGNFREVINEMSKPYFDPDMFNVKLIDHGQKIIWWSDRSGWGHYYVYNSKGQLLKELGNGSFTAGKIEHIDAAHQLVYFMAYGKEPGRNPYFGHLYSAHLNTGKLKLLTPENASHVIHFSPEGNFFVDTYSTIQQVPVTVVRYTTGNEALVLQKPAFKNLFNYGWKAAEPFVVKAADGVTDLYGIMWKPFNFDHNKKYPVISQVYPGPQTETVWTDFTVYDKYNNAPLAQLGFIVVCMGHRGGSPLRDKKYASFGYGNLRDAPLADDKSGLEQLGKRFSFIDTTRVGIFGHSGGGMMALAALCTYPNFYKVAVASSGDHDLSIYNRFWGETYQGVNLTGDSTRQKYKFNTLFDKSLVRNLKGNLLIVTGESDQNVHPSNTMRVVDALVRANKMFDMLVLPGQSHHYDEVYQPYFEKRLRNYFVEHLMGVPVSN